VRDPHTMSSFSISHKNMDETDKKSVSYRIGNKLPSISMILDCSKH
jgi:hypothetical protein